MLPKRLCKGDTIGLASPSSIATPQWAQEVTDTLNAMGYRVKLADNIFASGWGYAASDKERADDLNQLIRDDEVDMIWFGGGEGADDVLPLIDYEAAARHPKLWLSYSDGTSILNTVWAKTGIITCYGQSPGAVVNPEEYNLRHFLRSIPALPEDHLPCEPWHVLTEGTAEGTLIGGYVDNFLFLLGSGLVPVEEGRKYVLFLEDHQKFFGIEHESDMLARLEQMRIMPQVAGLIFGHYSTPVNQQLLQRLNILARRWNIPVAYCDDFGHDGRHGILHIGAQVTLDTKACTLKYHW